MQHWQNALHFSELCRKSHTQTHVYEADNEF